MTNMINVLVADDHGLFRDGLISVLKNSPDINVIGEAGDGLEAFVKTQQLKPDVVLMDINMPGTDGIEGAKLIYESCPDTKLVMLTMREDPDLIFEAIRNGAQGYLIKTIRATQLVEMVKSAARGEAAINPQIASLMLRTFRQQTATDHTRQPAPQKQNALDVLTRREQEILTYITTGLSDKEIASSLTISLYTVKSHVRNILSKLHVNNRREAARLAQRHKSG